MATQVTSYNREQGEFTVDPTALVPPPASPAEPAPVADETTPESAPVSVEPVTPESSDTEAPRGEGGFQRRIKTLVSQRNTLRDENAQLRAQLAIQGQPAPPPQPAITSSQPPASTGRPQPETYATHEEFLEALTDWKAGQRIEAAFRDREQQARQREQQTLDQRVQARFLEGQAKYDDFDEVLANPDARINTELLHGPVKQFLADNPRGVDVLYYLGTHPDVVAELNDRTPQGAARYLQQLEQRLAQAPPPRPSTPPPVPPVATMPPVRPLTGGTAAVIPEQSATAIAQNGGALRDYMKNRGYLR